MTDSQSVADGLSRLTDQELVLAIAAATAGRPALASIAAAANAIGGDVPASPDVPIPAEVPFPAGVPIPPDPTVVAGVPAPTTGPGLPTAIPAPDYTDSGVPTFDSVREKIETRAGTAAGATELDAESQAGRTVAEQWEERQKAAKSKLDEIRKAMDS
ncbi:PspA/IM30 family protein [Rhodococcus sp. NPDC055112]